MWCVGFGGAADGDDTGDGVAAGVDGEGDADGAAGGDAVEVGLVTTGGESSWAWLSWLGDAGAAPGCCRGAAVGAPCGFWGPGTPCRARRGAAGAGKEKLSRRKERDERLVRDEKPDHNICIPLTRLDSR
jgi:hypothetical protein